MAFLRIVKAQGAKGIQHEQIPESWPDPKGVPFLDELPESRKNVLEVLRQLL